MIGVCARNQRIARLLRSPEMPNLLLALALTFCAVFPQAASTQDLAPPQSRETTDRSPLKAQRPELLQRLGVNLISKARAAECTAEGETCTSNEECCPGLECAGGPPATCSTED
jgi:hypothetical protein